MMPSRKGYILTTWSTLHSFRFINDSAFEFALLSEIAVVRSMSLLKPRCTLELGSDAREGSREYQSEVGGKCLLKLKIGHDLDSVVNRSFIWKDYSDRKSVV